LLQKKINFAKDSSDSNDEAEIGLAKWTKKRDPVLCPVDKKEKEKYQKLIFENYNLFIIYIDFMYH
jgi:hypothetical protein